MCFDVLMIVLEPIPYGHLPLMAERRIAEIVCQSNCCKERGDISPYVEVAVVVSKDLVGMVKGYSDADTARQVTDLEGMG